MIKKILMALGFWLAGTALTVGAMITVGYVIHFLTTVDSSVAGLVAVFATIAVIGAYIGVVLYAMYADWKG